MTPHLGARHILPAPCRLLAGKSIRPGHVFITNSGEIEQATLDELEALVRSTIPVKEIHHTMAGCTIASHCGPKCLGVLFINE